MGLLGPITFEKGVKSRMFQPERLEGGSQKVEGEPRGNIIKRRKVIRKRVSTEKSSQENQHRTKAI